MAVDRNTARRLRAILDNEEYGPKLARLHGTEERRILDLIDAGRGTEARREILAADQRRREHLRVQARARLLHHAAVNTVKQHRHYGTTYDQAVYYLKYATNADLKRAATADDAELHRLAREPPRIMHPKDINPFWYH